MSVKDGKDYLYLVWKCGLTRQQYVVGVLSRNGGYEFKYGEEVKEAMDAGFEPLIAFSDFGQTYKNKELFPAFSSRLPDRKRRDINRILQKYELEEYDPYELLKKSGGKLPIDNLSFIDPILDRESAGEYEFYLAGARHYLGCEGNKCINAIEINEGDEIHLIHESENQYDESAIRIENDKNQILGYVPRYYTKAYLEFINEKRIDAGYVVSVYKENICDECIKVHIKVMTI